MMLSARLGALGAAVTPRQAALGSLALAGLAGLGGWRLGGGALRLPGAAEEPFVTVGAGPHVPSALHKPRTPSHVPCTAPDPAASAVRVALLDATAGHTKAVHLPNTGELLPVSTDCFEGVVHLRTRTDGDSYFQGKGRSFEIQVQGRFKRQPRGTVWFGAEVARPMQFSPLKRLLRGVVLRLVAAFAPSHVSLGESGLPGDTPHIVCPLLTAMDHVIITPKGHTAPTLGEDLSMVEGALSASRSHRSPAILPDHTYTMSFHSHYCDFEKWAVVGIPGFGPLDLHEFWQDMSLRVVCYAHPDQAGPQLVQDRDPVLQFDIVHRSLPRYWDLPSPQWRGAKHSANA